MWKSLIYFQWGIGEKALFADISPRGADINRLSTDICLVSADKNQTTADIRVKGADMLEKNKNGKTFYA